MPETGKKIKEEFGLTDESAAVKEYGVLNSDFMYANYPLIADEIISRLNLAQGAILDIGTGLGTLAMELAKRLPQAVIWGVDISEEMLKQARKNADEKKANNIRFLACDVHKMPFRDLSFDLIVSFGVLHHLRDVRPVFSGMKDALKPGGAAYVYDLKRDAPEDIVSEIASVMSPLQRKAFLESVEESLKESHLENILQASGFSEYALLTPQYSRKTLIKNKDLLRSSKFMGERFNKILFECFLKK